MNKFPCKHCLVKVNCSQYCKKLEPNNKIIDIYITSLHMCPDCGSEINNGSSLNKTTAICFSCSKVFQQNAHPKINMTVTRFSLPKSNNIIIDPNIQDSPSLSMEETHDIFYERLRKSESLYILRKINQQMKTDIMKIHRKDKAIIKLPSWEGKYKSINPDSNIRKQPTPSIIY